MADSKPVPVCETSTQGGLKGIRSKNWGILLFKKDWWAVFETDNRAVYAGLLPLFSLDIL